MLFSIADSVRPVRRFKYHRCNVFKYFLRRQCLKVIRKAAVRIPAFSSVQLGTNYFRNSNRFPSFLNAYAVDATVSGTGKARRFR